MMLKRILKIKSSNKAISPVIATAMLLVVAVIAVVGFQGWFSNYTSGMFTDTEIKSNSAIDGSLKIDRLIGDTLYIINNIQNNLSITTLKIGGNNCTITNNLSLGMNPIPISNCISDLTTSTPDIVLITPKNVVSKKVLIDNSANNLLNCSTLDGGEWIKVPGNSELGTTDFCVMKYEAKAKTIATDTIVSDGCGGVGLVACNSGGTDNWGPLDDYEPASEPDGAPWRRISWNKAKDACESLGNGFHLITDNEWLTIARDVSLQPENWDGEVVGTNNIPRGFHRILSGSWNDYSPAPNALSTCQYANGNGGSISCGSTGTFIDRRTLNLSNNEVIWDLAGNLWEWTDKTIAHDLRYHGGDQWWMSYHSDDGTTQTASNVPSSLLPPNTWNADQGMGRYFDGQNAAGGYNTISEPPENCANTFCSPTIVFSRGGNWYGAEAVGIFALSFDHGPSHPGPPYGFRCAYTK